MKTIYKVLPMIWAVGLFGCSNDKPVSQKAVVAEESDVEVKEDFVSKLPDTAPTLKVALTGDFPPFSFQDNYGNLQGVDIDSIRAIGEEQGFKVEFYKETWQGLFDSVESGSRDIAISGISYQKERDEKYGLSKPYFFNPSAIMYEKSKLNIQNLDDLKGLRVGALEGSRQADVLKAMGDDIELTTMNTSFLSYENLMQGKIDAIVDDLPILQYTAKSHPDTKVIIKSYERDDTPAAQQVILMAKDNQVLIDDVNEGITKLKAKGVFKGIEAKWLSEDNTAKEATPVAQ